MYRASLAFLLCLGLLSSATALHADPGDGNSEPKTPAQRLAAGSEARELFTAILKSLIPPGPASQLIDLLIEDDPSLWEDLETDYAEYLEETHDAKSLDVYVDFFESPLGKKWNEILVAIVEDALRDLDEPVSEYSGRETSPLGRLAKLLELDGDSVDLIQRSLSKKEIKKIVKFYESPRGQKWVTSSEEIMQELQGDFGPDSIMRRFAVLGCVAGIVAPNLHEALQGSGVDPSEVTPDLLRPMLGRIGPIQSICDCGIGEIVEQLGPEGFVRVQEGDAEALAAFEEILGSGDCIPAELKQAPTTALSATLNDMRNVGNAMMAWLVDRLTAGLESSDGSLLGATEEGWYLTPEEGQDHLFFHAISAQNLETLLVPQYLQELPRTDGWGHPYEFALNPNLLSAHSVSIRSAGQDGVFEEGPYARGPFSPVRDGLDRDLVFADGYFAVWPEGEEPGPEGQ